jgi:hypothetical protein
MKWCRYSKNSIDPTDPYPEMNGQLCLLPGGEYNAMKHAPPPAKPQRESRFHRDRKNQPGRLLSAAEAEARKQVSDAVKSKEKK